MNKRYNLLKNISRFADLISEGTSWIGIIIYMVLIVVLLCEVIMRYVFNMPLLWTSEVCEWIIVLMAYVCFAWVLLVDGHVKVDIIINILKPRNSAILIFLNSTIGLFYCLVSVWLYWMMFKTDIKYNTRTVDLDVPFAIFSVIGCIGFVFLCLQFLSRLSKNYQAIICSEETRKG